MGATVPSIGCGCYRLHGCGEGRSAPSRSRGLNAAHPQKVLEFGIRLWLLPWGVSLGIAEDATVSGLGVPGFERFRLRVKGFSFRVNGKVFGCGVVGLLALTSPTP